MKRYARSYKPYSVRRSEKKYRNRFVFSIILTLALAYLLIFWILPALIGGLSFFSKPATKEKSAAEDLSLAPPVFNIPFEATNTATIRFKGYAQADSNVEIYVDDELKKTVSVSTDGTFNVEGIGLSFGTNSISGKTLDNQNKASLSSKPIKIYLDNEKPPLEITHPPDNQEIKTERKLNVTGKTDSKDVQVLTINNIRTIINDDGSFTQTINLNDGENIITVSAQDQAGNSTQLSRKVNFQP